MCATSTRRGRNRQRILAQGRGACAKRRAPRRSSSPRRSKRKSRCCRATSARRYLAAIGSQGGRARSLDPRRLSRCSIWSPSSPPVRRRRAPGRSRAAPRRRRPRASSIPISSAASSAPRRSPTTITWPAAARAGARDAGKMRLEGKDYVVAGRRRHALPLRDVGIQDRTSISEVGCRIRGLML